MQSSTPALHGLIIALDLLMEGSMQLVQKKVLLEHTVEWEL